MMLSKLSGWDDTIVALATPHGVGALGVIRLSGPKAISIANELFKSKDLEKQASHTLHVGWLGKVSRLWMRLWFPCSKRHILTQARMCRIFLSWFCFHSSTDH
jgi:hypothetical protein